MAQSLALRSDFDGSGLRRLARETKHAGQARRLLALAKIYEGASRSKAAHVGGVGVQIVRDWVGRFNARGPDGLIDGKASGNKSKLTPSQRLALARIVEKGPTLEEHGVVRWRLVDLVKWLDKQFGVKLDETNVSR
jgi:transposase